MDTQAENVVCVYDQGTLIAIIKREEISRKTVTYMVEEADVDQLARLVTRGVEDKLK